MGELHSVTPRVEDELRALIRVTSAVAAAHRLEDVLDTVAEVSCGMLRAASVLRRRDVRAYRRGFWVIRSASWLVGSSMRLGYPPARARTHCGSASAVFVSP